MKKKIISIASALVLGAGASVIAPTTASAVVVDRVYNWKYSHRGTYVYTNKGGKGFFEYLRPGQAISEINNNRIESVAIPGRCHGVVDPAPGKPVTIDNSENHRAVFYNFRASMFMKGIIIELYCAKGD